MPQHLFLDSKPWICFINVEQALLILYYSVHPPLPGNISKNCYLKIQHNSSKCASNQKNLEFRQYVGNNFVVSQN